MSFYDARCGLTGISTKRHRVRLILLAKDGEHFAPIALPIRGSYNRLGGVTRIDHGYNTDFVYAELASLLVREELVLGRLAQWERQHRPLATIEDVLAIIERGTTLDERQVLHRGQPVVYMFVVEQIFQAMVALEPVPDDASRLAPGALVARAFPDRPLAARIYERLERASAEVGEAAREDLIDFLRFRAWFERYGLAWCPGAVAPHDDDDEDAFFDEAIAGSAWEPTLVDVLHRLWLAVAADRGGRDLTLQGMVPSSRGQRSWSTHAAPTAHAAPDM